MDLSFIASQIFKGKVNDRLLLEYSKYVYFILDVFLPSVDSENGNLIHLPSEGGVLDQPAITMNYLKTLQGLYRKHLAEQNKIQMRKRR